MRKASYIDTFSVGHTHEMFDASSLLMFSKLYEHIHYYARIDSMENVRSMLGELPANVCFHEIPLISHFGRFAKLRRMFKQIQATWLNIYYAMRAPEDVDVIINYYTVISIYPLNWYARLSRRRILLVCHGEMSELEKPRSKRFLYRQSLRFFKREGTKVAKNLWFAVLGEGIRKNLLPIVTPQIQEKLLSFEHSAIFTNRRKKTVKSPGKLVLGYIGGFRKSKGADAFLSLATHFKDKADVEFRFIGRTEGQDERIKSAGIVIPQGVGDHFLSREALYENILDLDYAVYCFPPEDYRFTASGSVFDAIDCDTPILAVRNDYFENMFKAYGEFGYQEADLDALIRRIAWLLSRQAPPEWNISQVRKQLSPRSVAKVFGESHWFKK